MAVETLTRTKCDRCKNVIEESPVAEETGARDSKPIIYVEQKGQPPIKFDDLCTKCSDRVDNLCKQLRLEKEEKEDKKPPTPSTESKQSTKGNKDSKKDKGSGSSAAPAN